HANCVPGPPRNEWPAGSVGAEVAALPFPDDEQGWPEGALPADVPAPRPAAEPAAVVRQPEDVPAPSPDVPPSRPARKRSALEIPDGPHADFLAAAVARKSVTNAAQLEALAQRLVTLDEAQAALSAMDDESEEADEALRKWAG